MHKQTRGSTRLREWMTKNQKNQKQLATLLTTTEITVSQPYVSGLLLGHPCSLPVAVQIKRVTKIPVEDWTVDADSSTDVVASAAKSA